MILNEPPDQQDLVSGRMTAVSIERWASHTLVLTTSFGHEFGEWQAHCVLKEGASRMLEMAAMTWSRDLHRSHNGHTVTQDSQHCGPLCVHNGLPGISKPEMLP